MIDFGGWEMPVSYSDISEEHAVVREKVGLFDLCHMGRIAISGPDAEKLVQGAQTNDLGRIKENQIRYAMLLNDAGGVLDDILVHRRPHDIFLVVNASNYDRDYDRLVELSAAMGRDAKIERLDELGMLALQGPKSVDVLKALQASGLSDIDFDGIGYYRLAEGKVLGQAATVTRTGYTGEDGFEIYLGNEYLTTLWDELMKAGEPFGLQPVGLGARDTLRLEAGMPLYGHEITETINPVEAGLMFGVRLKKDNYPGRDVLAQVKKEGPKRQLLGLTVEGRRIPRQGYAVFSGETEVGFVTSGTWSPSFERAIATALVNSSAVDSELSIDIRGRRAAARRVEIPFYKRDGSGSLNS